MKSCAMSEYFFFASAYALPALNRGMLVCRLQIKFLKTKEGCAMVQLGDALAVERAIGNLNNINIFGNKLQLG